MTSALMQEREDRALELMADRKDFDLALLSDSEFEEGLQLERIRQERIQKIILNDMVKGVDYGTVTGVDKPFAWEGSADKLIKRMRCYADKVGEPTLQLTDSALLVTVTVGIFDRLSGRLIFATPRSCSTLERRFRRKSARNGNPNKFDHPGECLNECIAMAFKRGKIAAALSAFGAKGYFANVEALDEEDDEEPLTLERALNVLVKGEPLSAIRNSALLRIADWAQKKMDADGEDVQLGRLLAAIKMVQAARESGEAKEPPKAAPTPVAQDGYDGPPREPGEDGR